MKTQQEIYAQMLAAYEQATGLSMDNSCDLAVRLNAAAAQLEALYFYADWCKKQSFPQTACGQQLDYHAQMRGITRKAAAAASGTLRFSIPAACGTQVIIPVGTAVCTQQQLRLVTTEQGIIAAGAVSTDILSRAVAAGAAGNLAASTALFLTQPPAGISACTLVGAFSGGSDEETDEALRQRILASYAAPPNSGNKGFYEQAALSYPGIAACSVIPHLNGSGTVGIIVTGQNALPSASLISTMQQEIGALRELGTTVSVQLPQVVNVDVRLTVWAKPGIRFSDASDTVQTAVRGFFTGSLLGKDLYRSELTAVVMNTGVISNCILQNPAQDVLNSGGELPVLGILTVTEGS